MTTTTRRRRRWAVPVGAVALFLGAGAVANIVPAHADAPNLPPLTPAELLAKVRTAQPPSLSGTVTLDSNLGLPSIGSLGAALGSTSSPSLGTLLGGSESAQVWMDGQDRVRIATSKPLAETNWVRNGDDLWSYDSSTRITRHATVGGPAPAQAGAPAAGTNEQHVDPNLDPAAFANNLLDEVTPSTNVTVTTPRYIDSRPVYELVLSPKAVASTISDAVISVDAATGVPLAVRVDAKSGSNPAFSLGFTSVRFTKPAASRFAFTPPPGSQVIQASSPAELVDPSLAERHDVQNAPRTVVPKGKVAAGKGFRRHGVVPSDPSGLPTPPPGPTPASNGPANVKTVDSDWSTVAIVANGGIPPLMNLFAQSPTINVGNQQGHVLTTKVLTAILLPDGRLAIGALTPSALASAVAAAG